MERIRTQGFRFSDESGRIRIFNGMNIDDKDIGAVFRFDLDDAFFEKFIANGFNLIRLAVQWANIEPIPGQYSESYLGSIDAIFRRAERFGVYILLDMHQDLYSGFGGVGGGDGAPDWACVTDGYRAKPYKHVWSEAYAFGKWVHRCFDHFWRNDPVCGKGLQDHYADLWRMLANRYGDSPALFGYDLLNEPAPGSAAKKMVRRLVLSGLRQFLTSKKIKRSRILRAVIKKDWNSLLAGLPGSLVRDVVGKLDRYEAVFDRQYYSPFLNRIAAAIREVTPNGILMIEQPFLCNTGVRLSVPTITVNGEREPLQCFGPHAYDLTVDTPLYRYADTDRVKAFFAEMRRSQNRLGVPAIVGEWGGCSDNTDTGWFPHARALLAYFDGNEWGQLYWRYREGDLDAPLMQMLSRSYPVAIAGSVQSYGYSKDRRMFTLRYLSDGTGETLLYVHAPCTIESDAEVCVAKAYPNGASLLSLQAAPGPHRIALSFGASDPA